MYLKSIEVHGFKSFANKIKFDFHNGITGIVGPNGSGKSNVADAVRWVLGEQKVKQLRSSSMQDVIFAGTESRKPQSYAYVAITLDNTDHALALDFSEVTIARRVYRSGESEYLINGSTCRLRDVHELFYDTGIGKEGYSIIGQGQIDKILAGKPEERRELFDEAAGIVKYKRRKATAQKKLESEQANLVRVNDILSELEKQIGPLERQSEAARTYLKKRDELKTFDVNMFLLETERLTKQLKELEANQQIAEQQFAEAQEAFDQVRAQYEQMTEEIEAKDLKINELREELSNTGLTKEKLEGQLNVLREQIKSLQQSGEQLKERELTIQADIAEREGSKTSYEEALAAISGEIQAMDEKKAAVYGKRSQIQNQIADLDRKIEDGKDEMIQLLNQKAVHRGEQQRLNTMMEQANIKKAELNQKLLSQQSTEADLKDVLATHQETYNHLVASLEELKQEESKIEAKLDKWKEKSNATVKQIEEAQQEYHKDASRLESLKNIAERYDGYGNSIRRVMEKKAEVPGIHGVVADLIKVEKKYEVAIETALGGSIQNIVTSDEATAKEMITYLKENRLGRATFLPLTSVKKRDMNVQETVLKETGVVGYADTLVQTDDKYRGIAGHLLGRTLVVDHIDHAIALAKKYRYTLRMVTLEGESLQPGGSMTGGAFKNSSNLLGRNREIQALEASVKETKALFMDAQERLEDIKTARELLKEDLASVREDQQKAELALNTAKLNLARAKEEQAQQEEFFKNIREESQLIAIQMQDIQGEKDLLLQQMKDSEARQDQIQEESQQWQASLEEQNDLLLQVQEELSSILVEDAAVRQKAGFQQENIDRIEQEIAKLTEDLAGIRATVEEGGTDAKQKEHAIEEIQLTIQAAVAHQAEVDAALQEEIQAKDAMTSQNKDYFEQRDALSEQKAALDKELFRLNERKEKVEGAIESQAAYMWEEYELTLHAAMPLRNPEYNSLPEIKKHISTLKDEIKKLGPVNIHAIEEYKEVSERYNFMNGQRNDLVEAEQTLLDIIADLDAGMRKQFNEKFAEIQREFDKAFKELFGGGKGTLELTEDEDVLECGVRIIAQPPGKKLQNMMQLSGGEKALTAIALLFAIQNLKPSPFCLLDEIEAALDDSNVVRFAKYLHKLTKNTQFIIITHRRGTMNAADRLYGITMQEKGISTLVSVNLIEKDLDE